LDSTLHAVSVNKALLSPMEDVVSCFFLIIIANLCKGILHACYEHVHVRSMSSSVCMDCSNDYS
jgi:hypothetical protein